MPWTRVEGWPGLYRLPGGGYFVRFRSRGRVVARSAGTELGFARRLLQHLRAVALAAGAGLDRPDCALEVLVGDYLGWASRRLAAATVEGYRGCLARIIGGVGARQVGDVTLSRVEQYVARRKAAGRRDRTVNVEVSALRRLLGWAVGQGIIGENPLRLWRRLPERDRREQRALTVAEFRRLLSHEHPAGGRGPRRTRPCDSADIWLMLGLTGLRMGELRALRWTDVLLEVAPPKFHVPGTKTRRSDRWLPLPAPLVEMLRRRERAGPYVFPRGNWRMKFRRCVAAAGVEAADLTLHTLRRSWFTWLMSARQPLPTVMRAGGHARAATTLEIYAQMVPEDLQRAMEFLGGLLSGPRAEDGEEG